MSVEGLGPSEQELTGPIGPADAGANVEAAPIAAPEAPAEPEQVAEPQPATSQPEAPQAPEQEKKVPLWGKYMIKLRERREQRARDKSEKEAAEERERARPRPEKLAEKAARRHERRARNNAEVLKVGASSPDELLDLIANNDFKRFQEIERESKYGKGFFGRAKALMNGEYDFRVDNEGNIQRNMLAEAGKKALGIASDKRTIAKALTYLGLGAITGGFGWAAGGVLFGGMAGRGVAEMVDLVGGKTSGAREKVLLAERERWEELQALALKVEQEQDPKVKNDITREIVDLMYRQGDHVLLRNLAEAKQDLIQSEQQLNKWRSRLTTAGELVGGVAGIHHLLSGLGAEHIDLDSFGAIVSGHPGAIHQSGEGIFHAVQLAQNHAGVGAPTWNFLYNSAHEAAAATMAHAHFAAGVSSHFGAHVLQGASDWLVAGATIAERTLPMLLASGIGAMAEKASNPYAHKFVDKQPDGSVVRYYRTPDGRYMLEEKEQLNDEEKKKDPHRRARWRTREVVANMVPERFRKQFEQADFEDKRKAERLQPQIPTTQEMLQKVADENHVYIPGAPHGFDYDWDKMPQMVRSEKANLEKLEQWHPADPQARLNRKDGELARVWIAGVDQAANRIAIIDYAKDPLENGSQVEWLPVITMRLDEFMQRYRPFERDKAGRPQSNETDSRNRQDRTDNQAPNHQNQPRNVNEQLRNNNLVAASENKGNPYKLGQMVRVERTSGALEDDWQVNRFLTEDGKEYAAVRKPNGKGGYFEKNISIDRLKEMEGKKASVAEPGEEPLAPTESANTESESLPIAEYQQLWQELGSAGADELSKAGIMVIPEHTVALKTSRTEGIIDRNVAQLRSIAFAYYRPGEKTPVVATLDYTTGIDGLRKSLTLSVDGQPGERVTAEHLSKIKDYLASNIGKPFPDLEKAIDTFAKRYGPKEENLKDDGLWINQEDNTVEATDSVRPPAPGPKPPINREARADRGESRQNTQDMASHEQDEMMKVPSRPKEGAPEPAAPSATTEKPILKRQEMSLNLPEDFNSMDSFQRLEWLKELIDGTTDQYPWDAISARVGKSETADKTAGGEIDFIEFVDDANNRKERLFFDAESKRLMLYREPSAATEGQRPISFTATPAEVRMFVNLLLLEVNKAMRDGKKPEASKPKNPDDEPPTIPAGGADETVGNDSKNPESVAQSTSVEPLADDLNPSSTERETASEKPVASNSTVKVPIKVESAGDIKKDEPISSQLRSTPEDDTYGLAYQQEQDKAANKVEDLSSAA